MAEFWHPNVNNSNMATLVVKRRSEWINRLRNLELHLNGRPLGKIASGETKTFTIPAGRHVLKSTIDWAGSPEIAFTVQEQQTQAVEVKAFSGSGFLFLTALLEFPLFLLLLFFPATYQKYPVLDYALWALLLPAFLLLLYKITLGRQKYLELELK